ncbi:MAG: hypothetical protein R3E89_07435 [Thiolinea sp.]
MTEYMQTTRWNQRPVAAAGTATFLQEPDGHQQKAEGSDNKTDGFQHHRKNQNKPAEYRHGPGNHLINKMTETTLSNGGRLKLLMTIRQEAITMMALAAIGTLPRAESAENSPGAQKRKQMEIESGIRATKHRFAGMQFKLANIRMCLHLSSPKI